MSILTRTSILNLIFFCGYWIAVFSIEPEFIWNVVNTTIADYQSYCPKVVLYSKENKNLVDNKNITGWETILININEQEPEKWKEKVQEVKAAMDKLNLDNQHPCIIMVSIVNTSTNSTISSNASEVVIQETKLRYSQQFVELLQFKTPMNCRKLVLVRLADHENELFSCTKAAKYPRRLVPVWEQLLFDFFSTVKVIQGRITDDETELKVSKETGKWIWLCQDIIDRLEAEEKCERNKTTQCREDEAAGEFSNLKGNNSFCSSNDKFKPRQ